MLILLLVLLILWLILSAVGFVLKGIIGLAFVVMLFVIIAGAVLSYRNSSLKKASKKK